MNLIEEIARLHPDDAPAVHDGRRLVTYGELFAGAKPVADAIRDAAAPLGRRPRVGLHCPNGLDYIMLAMGILLADACLVPLAEELTAEERDEITRTTALDLILQHGGSSPPTPAAGGTPPWHLELLTCLPAVASAKEGHFEPAFPEDEFQALNPAFIRFSSGTTGTSKGVVLSHESLLARITAANEGMRIGPEDRILWMLPMAHHFAVSIVLYLHAGALTLLESSPTREDVLACAERHEATVIYGSPFHFAQLAADRGDFDWPSLRLAVATAAKLPEATGRAFHQRFGTPLVQGLGIIEVGLSVLNLDAALKKPGSLGKPLPAYTVELRDPDGRTVADGTPGEFHVRGPGLLDAYLVPWNPNPLQNGFFASGDLVMRDADGHLTLVGRLKSVINVAGMKVFPEEVEAVLNLHPAVKASRVLGRDHPQMGQIPVAEIIPADPEAPPKPAALQRYCREHISAYKVPLRYGVVDEIPLTASGKVRRH